MIAILAPGDDVPSVGIPNLDKVVHFGMFACITACFVWEYYRANNKLAKTYLTALYFIIFAAVTEVMQYFVPGRSCDIKDLIADALGIVIAVVLINKLITYKK